MFEKRKIHLSYVYDKNFHVRKFDAPRFHRKIKKINTVMIFMTEVDEKCYSIWLLITKFEGYYINSSDGLWILKICVNLC